MFDEDARATATARARTLAPDRSWTEYVKFEPENSWYEFEYPMVYLMAYELMVRGIDCRLEMAQQVSERALGEAKGVSLFRGGADAVNFRPHVTYTTGLLAEHIAEIDDLHAFDVYVPSRDEHDYELTVAPEDIEEAFALARELKVRMSMLWHPEQGLRWHEKASVTGLDDVVSDFKFHR